jgi:hypothetical protein
MNWQGKVSLGILVTSGAVLQTAVKSDPKEDKDGQGTVR